MAPRETPAVLILGSGPNRIGQGVEFDYSCVHASFALRDAGYDTVMVNCNPETVSTDYDTSSRLYFEPLTLEDVLEVVHAEQQAGPVAGVIVQLGGQTPLGLAKALKEAGVPIVGTSPEAIDLAEDRGAFGRVLAEAQLPAPKHGTAYSAAEAVEVAREIGYPVLVRPSYVLGGRGMEIVYDDETLATYVTRATVASPEHPVLVDRFLDDAIEIDVDALYDGTDMYLGGIMEHIEEAGIHSGDSACTLPPVTLGVAELERVREATLKLAEGIGVRGLMNVQFALAQDILYVLEANPRASRTVPFVAKATGVPVAKAAARVMLGATIKELREEGLLPAARRRRHDAEPRPGGGQGGGAAVQAVPHHATARSSTACSGRRCARPARSWASTRTSGRRSPRACSPPGPGCPREGRIFVSVANRDKRAMIFPVKRLADLGFTIVATTGTADVLRRNGIPSEVVRKHSERSRRGREHRRPDPRRRHRHGGQHPERSERARRRLRHPRRDDVDGQADHHHRAGAGGGRAGHRGPDAGRVHRQAAAGARPRPRPLRRRHRLAARPRGSRERGDHAAYRRHGSGRRAGDRRADRDPAGRRLPPPDLRGARVWPSSARPGPVRGPRGRRRHQRQPAAPLLLDPQGRARRAPTAAPSTSSSRRSAPGTEWLSTLRAHDEVDIVGPLGRPFPLPTEPVACVLVGGGYGSAPLFWLAEALRERGCHVEMVLGAATESKLFGVVEARRYADGVSVTTDDGSAGTKGWVSDVLPEVIRRTGAAVVYGCGPMGMLKSITDVAAAEGAVAQVAVEESMACGVGVCMTCVMPVTGNDGATRMVRSCVEGPVFRGDRVRWDAFVDGLCRVPADAVGAPRVGGH